MNLQNTQNKDFKNSEIRKINIFCSLPDAAVELIERHKVLNFFKRGQCIFYAGNFPSGLYCVNSGVIRLETISGSGSNHILQVVQQGGILGYRSLFADEAYEATAVVHEDASVGHIPKASVLELISRYPEVGLKFLSWMSQELRLSEDRMCGLADKNAAERIAEAVLFLKEHYNNQTWTRKEIAEWAGTSPETVMRTLADFASEEILELKGRKINILKRDALFARANLAF